MRKFHVMTIQGVSELSAECRSVDCRRDHVYQLDRREGQALRDLIDERLEER